MADVLSPMVGSSNTMTILHPQDAFQASQAQAHAGPRAPQLRNSMYNPQLSAMGYRAQGVAISPYAFNTTPALKTERRKSAGAAIGLQSGQMGLHDSCQNK